MVVSVCLRGQCLEDSSSHYSFPLSVCLSVVINMVGQGGRCGGPGKVPFLLKKSLGKTGGLAFNQTKIQFF